MRKLLFAVIFCCLAMSAFAASAKIETISKPADSPVPETVWQALEQNGYRVVFDDSSVACDVWLRKAVPSSNVKETEGALYPQLLPSTMVGLISFPKAATDYRGEAIKPGFYTLRYVLLPNDGNHLGVAPNRDFLLLIPVASDPDPNAQFKYQELINLSRKATGTQHPGPLSMVGAGAAVPGISQDDQEHWIFSAKLTLVSGEAIPFGLIVKGTAPQ
jgi:hypothetical protein